jgi:hypothetical protein
MAKRGPQPKFDTEKRIKWCNRCKGWKSFDDFGDNKNTASGKAYYCRPCHNLYCRQFWTSVSAYEYRLEKEYGLTPLGYLAYWRTQDKKCAICRGDLVLYNRATCVDYDPATKKVWGLLCDSCTKLKKSPGLLLAAARYFSYEEPK